MSVIPNLNAIQDDEVKRAFESLMAQLGVLPQLLIADGPGISEPNAHPKKLSIYVDAVDGDLKAKFGNGEVETLAPLTPWSAVTYLNVHDVHLYGAVGDGIADDRTAIQAAAAAAGPGGMVYFRPRTTYRIKSGLILAYDDQTWWMYGVTIAVDFVGAGITLGADTIQIARCKIFGGIVQTFSAAVDWTAGGIGYKLLKCNNCMLRDVSVRWLEKGIEIRSPAPPNQSETTQNWIEPSMIASCALPIWMYADDGGTINENQFRGGQISYAGTDPSAVGRYALTINHHATSFGNVNGIKFIGTYFGNSKTTNKPKAVYLDAVATMFDACHIEGFDLPTVTFAGDALVGGLPNVFWGGGANWLTPEIDLDSGVGGIAAPFIFSGYDGAGIAGGKNAGSAYVWLAKVLGAGTKIAYAVKDAADALTFTVRGDGIVTSGKNTVEGGYRLNGPAATSRAYIWQTAGVARWDARANATAEGGSDAGSDFTLNAYTDAGTLIGAAMTVTRATLAFMFGNAVRSNHATAGIGYATGAGGTVTQATDKTTGVTLDKITGLITMNAAALNADTTVSFTLTNSAIAATDTIVLQHNSAGTAGAYLLNAQPAAGSASISVRNITAGNLSEAIVLRFTVLKSVSS